jgi:hypothetical protein
MQEEVRPTYYNCGGIEVFAIIDAYGLDFYEGNAVKYLLRWRKKGGVEDLKKALTYLQYLIRQQEGKEAEDAGSP